MQAMCMTWELAAERNAAISMTCGRTTNPTPGNPPRGSAQVTEGAVIIAHYFCRLGERVHKVRVVVHDTSR